MLEGDEKSMSHVADDAEKSETTDMSSATGAKNCFNPSSVVAYARLPAKTLAMIVNSPKE